MILVWLSPIVLFAALIFSRRITILWSAICATGLSIFVASFTPSLNQALSDLFLYFMEGVWTSLPAILVILAGLFFSTIVVRKKPTTKTGHSFDHLATSCLLIGPFLETATGFGVGYAVALAQISHIGINKSLTLALAAFSQYLVPWGALAIGSRISAEIAGLPLSELAWQCALLCTIINLLSLPIFFKLSKKAGYNPTQNERLSWGLIIVLLHALLIATNLLFPMELAGLMAIGTIIILRQLILKKQKALTINSLKSITPYLALILALGITRLIPPIFDFLNNYTITPHETFRPFSYLLSPALPLLIIACIISLCQNGLNHTVSEGKHTIAKGIEVVILTGVLVGMATILVRSGITTALVKDIASYTGVLTPTLLPLFGALGGYLTGSNLGAGSMSIPMVTGFSLNQNITFWLASTAIVTGSTMTALSPIRMTMGQKLLNASDKETAKSFKSLIPFGLISLSIGIIATLLFTNM